LLTLDEEPPLKISVAQKSHTTKVLFLSVIAKPRIKYTRRQSFDGLIGMYPVGELDMYVQTIPFQQPRDKEWSNINIDMDGYQQMHTDLVVHDIKKKMLVNKHIILQ
jgi:hypothetical protein